MTLKKVLYTLTVGFVLVAGSAYAAPAHPSQPFRSGLGLSRASGPNALAAWEDFDGGFETGDFSQYLEVQAAAGRATVVKSPVGEGTYAARFERRVGDELIAGSNRSEAVPKAEFGAGETRYFRHLLYLPFGSIDWNHFLILCQWHDSSAGAPPLSLQTFEKEGTKELLIGSGTQKSIYYEFDIPGDSQWFELVYRITFGAKGSMEVWLDGKSLGEVTEIDTLGTEPTNWKLGNYRSSEAEGTTVVFQDGVKITKSFFSNPPQEPAKDAVVPSAASPQAPSGNSHAPEVDAKPCQLAKGELRKARVRLSAARRHYRNSSLQVQRSKWAKRVNQNAKSFQLAKRRVRRICQA
jgi:hypothetical protein